MEGFSVVYYNKLKTRVENVSTGILNWVHERRALERPPHIFSFENEVQTSIVMKLESSSTGGGDSKCAPAVHLVFEVNVKTPVLQCKPRATENDTLTVTLGRSERTPIPVNRLLIKTMNWPLYIYVVRKYMLHFIRNILYDRCIKYAAYYILQSQVSILAAKLFCWWSRFHMLRSHHPGDLPNADICCLKSCIFCT